MGGSVARSDSVLKLRACLLIAAASSLVACGGGGGASDNPPSPPAPQPPPSLGFVSSAPSINLAASVAGTEPLSTSFLITVTDPARNYSDIRATYTENGIDLATSESQSLSELRIHVSFEVPHVLGPGTYQDTIRVGFCAPGCTEFAGTTVDVPVTYTVTVGTLPTVTIGSDAVSIARLPWDSTTPDSARLDVEVSSATRFAPHLEFTRSSNGIANVISGASVNEGNSIIISFKPATELAPGLHTDTIDVVACIDDGCKYPLTITPSTITVDYDVTPTMPGPQGFTVRKSAQPVADVLWSEARQALYATVPASAPEHASSVVELEPVTEAMANPVAVGFDPHLLALANDESRLYVSERGGDSIQRFTTAPLTADVLISLGNDPEPPNAEPLFALDLQVAPTDPRLLAVRRGLDRLAPSAMDIALFDDAVPRPMTTTDQGNLVWDPTGTLLYTNVSTLAVDADGLGIVGGVRLTQGRLRFHDGLIYSDNSRIVDPTNDNYIDEFPGTLDAQVTAIDPGRNRAYVVSQTFTPLTLVKVFDLSARQLIGTAILPPFGADVVPTRIVTWGDDGVALVNSANELYFVHGPLIE